MVLEVGPGMTGGGSDLFLPRLLSSSGSSRDLHPGQNPEAQMEVCEHDWDFGLLLGNTLNYTEEKLERAEGQGQWHT